jgi:hypothetical protein
MDTAKCKKCRAEIVFLQTKKTTMPVDVSSVIEGDTQFEYGKHVSHFSTCPYGDQFRKKKK